MMSDEQAQDSFFVADGQDWLATVMTRGPWSTGHQHAGPPSALLARAMEQEVGDGFRFVRVTVEIYKPVPIARLALKAEVTRSGRTVRYVGASLYDASGKLLMQAVGLAIRENPLELPAVSVPPGRSLAGPGNSADFEFNFFTGEQGYHRAMQLARAEGEFGKGPCAIWMRMRIPLVAGETPSPLQRVMIAADSGNGISMVLNPREYGFVNPDLTVYLHRYPQGEWVCLDAGTTPQPDGIGLAVSELRDEEAVIGRGLQSLVISRHAS